MDGISHKMEKARQHLHDYDNYDPDKDDGNELVDVADLIVENKMLLDRVDAMFDRDEQSDQSTTQNEEDESSKLSESYINQMYK